MNDNTHGAGIDPHQVITPPTRPLEPAECEPAPEQISDHLANRIASCPTCIGWDPECVISAKMGDDVYYQVICKVCGRRGPEVTGSPTIEGRKGAILEWNRGKCVYPGSGLGKPAQPPAADHVLAPVTTRSIAAQIRKWAAITFPGGMPRMVEGTLDLIENIDPPKSTYKDPGQHRDGQGNPHHIAPIKEPGTWRSPMPMLYASMMHGLREVAESHGYCIAIHGSMVRDFDIIAVPWRDPVSPPQVLVEAIQATSGWLYNAKAVGPSERPHGRLAWTIPLGLGTAIDLSIIPPTTATPP